MLICCCTRACSASDPSAFWTCWPQTPHFSVLIQRRNHIFPICWAPAFSRGHHPLEGEVKWRHLFEEQAHTPDLYIAVTCGSCWLGGIGPSILAFSVTLKPPSIHLSTNSYCCLTPSWSLAIYPAFIVSK